MSLYDKMSIGFGSGFGVGTGKLFNLKPTDGTGDFTVVRADTDATELVTNGSFATDTNWTKGTGWTIGSGVATSTGAVGNLEQTSLGVAYGEQYYIEVTTSGGSYNNSGLQIKLSGDTAVAAITADGSYVFLVTVGAGANDNIEFVIATNNAFVGSIDDVSVKSADYDYLATRINADGLIEGVRPNVPRASYPLKGSDTGCPFLLLEPSSTNDLLQSEDFTTTWVKANGSIVADDTSDPSGGTAADKYNENGANNTHTTTQSLTGLTDATAHAFSLFVKADERDRVRIECWSGYADFDLTNEVVLAESAVTSSKIEDYGNGWFRISIIKTSTATTTDCVIYMLDAAGASSYIGTNGEGMHLWGAMLEELDYVTSYIPTTTTAKTRAADEVNNAGAAADFNSVEGVLVVQMAALVDDTTDRIISISDGTNANIVSLQYYTESNQIEATVKVSSVATCNIEYDATDILEWKKLAFRYKENDFSLWAGGGEVGFNNIGTVPAASTLTELSFDNGAGADDFYGKVYNLMHFNSYLTNDEMQYLTLADNFLFEDGEAFLFD